MVIETKVVISWLKLQLWRWLLDLNYNFENKLFDNKNFRKQVGKEFLKPITMTKIIFLYQVFQAVK